MKELKTDRTVCPKNPWLFLFIMLVMLCLIAFAQLSAFAQSGRGIPPPPSTPTPTPQSKSRWGPDAKMNFGADVYRVVFPTGYEGKRSYRLDGEKGESRRATVSLFSNFIEQLNKAGAQGFKVKSANYGGMIIAILKPDEVQHEYDWFETTSEFAFTIDGFEEKYREATNRGFRLIDDFLVDFDCEYRDPDNVALGQDCEWHHVFLLERERGVEKPKQFILAHDLRLGMRTGSAELTAQIKEQLANGFYPRAVFTKWEILLTQTEDSDELSTDIPEVEFVTSSFRNDVRKKVNELAKQGYKLAMIDGGAAVMYRYDKSATPVSYFWLDATKKDFEKQLAKMQENGAVYRLLYRNHNGHTIEHQLVFEQGMVVPGGGQKREYRVLKFEFRIAEDSKLKSPEKKVEIDLTPASKETVKLMNSLAKEGFVVRDLFLTDKPSVLLERSR